MTAPDVNPVDRALDRVVDDGRDRARAEGHAELWESVAAATHGGKRFRPALLMAAHDALGGAHVHAAAKAAAAIELLHTAFVIHDDVIDGDDVRRGRLNPVGTFAARARAAGAGPGEATDLGRTAGILAGDLAITAAIRTVARCGAPADVTDRLLDLFDDALHATAAGELADVRLSMGPGTASLAESLLMEEQKTSVYSFSLPLQAGAVLAGASADTVSRLGEAGRSLGIAFQLLDDLIGIFGDQAETGKSSTGDLRTGKQTPLLVHATGTPTGGEILRYVGRELDEHELDEVRRLLVSSGSRDFVERLVESHLTRAREVVRDVAVDLVAAVDGCFPDAGTTGTPAATHVAEHAEHAEHAEEAVA